MTRAEQRTYQEEIRAWRQRMEASLRAEDGWLTLIGLFWLEEGLTSFGSAPDNAIMLPAGKAPDYAGSFELHDGETILHVARDAAVLLNGTPVESAPVRPETSHGRDLVTLGDIAMFVIKRGERYAVRVRDRHHPARETFAGRRWFPVDELYRVTATFTAYETRKTLSVLTILGTTEDYLNPGYLTFTLDGRECRLEALVEGDRLFIIFHDRTSGESTYPAARFLKAAMPEDGKATLDFNKAYNPPCAFTDFATCPLPPTGNQLPVRVEAGEQYEYLSTS